MNNIKRIATLALISTWVLLEGGCRSTANVPVAEQWDTYSCGSCSCNLSPSAVGYSDTLPGTLQTCARSAQEAVTQCDSECKTYGAGQGVYACKAEKVQLLEANSCKRVYTRRNANELMAGEPANADYSGVVDFGRSWVRVNVLNQADSVEAKIKGKVSAVGGTCSGAAQCSMQLWKVRFEPVGSRLTTDNGLNISGLKLLNNGVWNAVKYANGSVVIAQGSRMSLSLQIDHVWRLFDLTADSYFKGKMVYNTYRIKTNGQAVTGDALLLDGTFITAGLEVKLHLHVWMPRCRPQAKVWATCGNGPDGSGPFLFLHSAAPTYPQPHNRDLCDAFAAQDPTQRCAAQTIDPSRFSCIEPSSTKVPAALPAWKDANGTLLHHGSTAALPYLPSMPIHFFQNVGSADAIWQRIQQPPSGNCPSYLVVLKQLR